MSPDGPARDDTDASSRPSITTRRAILSAGGAVCLAAFAGCLGPLSSGSARRPVEREEPTTPRSGTPGEFYALLEANDVRVESLYEVDSTLELTYRSAAETALDSDEEIGLIVHVYNENLVKNDAGIETLYADVADPFDGQIYGWGVQTEWLEQYNDGEIDQRSLWSTIFATKVYEADVEG